MELMGRKEFDNLEIGDEVYKFDGNGFIKMQFVGLLPKGKSYAVLATPSSAETVYKVTIEHKIEKYYTGAYDEFTAHEILVRNHEKSLEEIKAKKPTL